MAEIRADQPLVPSVLDRLLDFAPEVSREPPLKRTQVLREMKQSLRRDLENLLNTRTRCLSWPPELEELKQSLVNYGIPDLTGATLGSTKEREEFCRTLQVIIREHEPRLRNVKVRLLDQADPIDRTLHFRIDALMLAEPAPEPIVFDSNLRVATSTFEVKGEAQ
jgi:type VI secretion system protein ImpF